MGLFDSFEIIDISQPVDETTACFPGDVPFSHQLTMDYQTSQVINLTAFTMSPHVGTHADAPLHIHGDMQHPGPRTETIGQVPLSPYIGPAAVIDVSPCREAITWAQVAGKFEAFPVFPQRVLFRTLQHVRPDVFEPPYAWFSVDLVRELSLRGVVLVGLDTPSVDAVDSKTLETHHALLSAGMSWLENLDLGGVQDVGLGYFLVALPLKLMGGEASPVRAVLLKA